MPVKGSKLRVHYTGTLENGTVFDSSSDKGKPMEFELGANRVIECWESAFATLKKGAKARITCPPEMAYGKKDRRKIPGNSTLKFEVELVDFVPPFVFSVQKEKHLPGQVVPPGSVVSITMKGMFAITEKVFDDRHAKPDFPLKFTSGTGRLPWKCVDMAVD